MKERMVFMFEYQMVVGGEWCNFRARYEGYTRDEFSAALGRLLAHPGIRKREV